MMWPEQGSYRECQQDTGPATTLQQTEPRTSGTGQVQIIIKCIKHSIYHLAISAPTTTNVKFKPSLILTIRFLLIKKQCKQTEKSLKVLNNPKIPSAPLEIYFSFSTPIKAETSSNLTKVHLTFTNTLALLQCIINLFCLTQFLGCKKLN